MAGAAKTLKPGSITVALLLSSGFFAECAEKASHKA
jgi:hypothetical protein